MVNVLLHSVQSNQYLLLLLLHASCGFFLFNIFSEKPVFYEYKEGELKRCVEIEQIELKHYFMGITKKSLFKIKKENWGYTIFSKRFYKEKNGIVLKVIIQDIL